MLLQVLLQWKAISAIPPGHQLLRQTAAYVAPESPAEQPVQTRQEPMHTGMSAAPEKSVNYHKIIPKHQMLTRRGAASMDQEHLSSQAVLGQRMSKECGLQRSLEHVIICTC